MKNRGTYALLALFFAGLIGLWVADFARVPTRSERERMSSRLLYELLDTKPDELHKIEILGGEEPIVFERQGEKGENRWQMTAPMNVAADPSKVETLAYNLKELSRKPEAATLEGDPERFGLAPPERIIRLWGASTDAPLVSLELGKTSLDRRFVRRVGSEGVEVVDAKGLDLVKLLPGRWRDHELFRVPSFEVDSVKIEAGGKELKLKRGRDAWRIDAPFHALAAESKVDGLIADLGTLRVLDDTRFVANDVKGAELDRFGLKDPALTITVDAGRVDRRRPEQILHVGKPVEGAEGQVYVKRGDQDDVVIVDTRVLKDLKPDPNAFRSPKVADMAANRVSRIGVEPADGGNFEVVRSGNDWTIVRPSTAPADRQAIQEFLKSLDQVQTNIYLTPQTAPDSGLDKPALVLKLWQVRDPRDPAGSASIDPDREPDLTLQFGRLDAARKTLYARIPGDPTILALPDSVNGFLPRSQLAFRDRQILAGSTDQIERLKFSGLGRKTTLHAPIFKLDPLKNAPIGWWMVEPVAAPADSQSVGRLLKLLAHLRAETLVSERSEDLEKYGLKSPAFTFTWSNRPGFSMVPEKPRPGHSSETINLEDHTLLIGANVPGRANTRYAKVADNPLIFTLGPEAIEVLDSEWHDRQVLSFDAKHVRKIQLDWPERGFSLNSIQDAGNRKWSLEGPIEAAEFDLARVNPLLEATSKLATTRFLQYEGEIHKAAKLEPARLSIRLDLLDGSPVRTLRIGGLARPGQLFATTATGSQGPVFLVPETPFAPWLKPPRRHDDLPENVFAP